MDCKIKGQTYALKFNYRTVSEAEEAIGKSLPRAIADGLKSRDVAILATAGLKLSIPNLTWPKVLDMMEEHRAGKGKVERDIAKPIIVTLSEQGFLGDASDPELMRRALFDDEGEGGKAPNP